jgi:O-antigen/teichoic acid export membrane protein
VKKYAIIKIISVGLLVAWGFLQPTLFSKYLTEDKFSFLTIAYGYGLFLEFFDFGMGKPLYATVRSKFIKGEDYITDMQGGILIFTFIFLYSFFIFTGVLFLKSYFSGNHIGLFTLIFLSASITLTIFFNHLKNFLFAIDAYMHYEYIDIVRKLLNLGLIFLVITDNSYTSTVFFTTISLLLLLAAGLHKINKYIPIKEAFAKFSFRQSIAFIQKLSHDAGNSFLYSLCLSLSYHIGFLIVPFYLDNFAVIQYGLWYKIVYGASMFIGALSDMTIHQTTRNYHESNTQDTLYYLAKTVGIGLAITSGIFLFLYFFKEHIFKLWVGSEYMFDLFQFIAMLLYFVGRSLQHITATFIISVGGEFSTVKKVSIIFLLITLISSIFTLHFGGNLGELLVVINIIVFLDALVYVYLAFKKLSVGKSVLS